MTAAGEEPAPRVRLVLSDSSWLVLFSEGLVDEAGEPAAWVLDPVRVMAEILRLKLRIRRLERGLLSAPRPAPPPASSGPTARGGFYAGPVAVLSPDPRWMYR